MIEEVLVERRVGCEVGSEWGVVCSFSGAGLLRESLVELRLTGNVCGFGFVEVGPAVSAVSRWALSVHCHSLTIG
jgi:hypothetical protein